MSSQHSENLIGVAARLPKNILNSKADVVSIAKGWGAKISLREDYSEHFIYTTLPLGWKIITANAQFLRIITDNKGVHRAKYVESGSDANMILELIPAISIKVDFSEHLRGDFTAMPSALAGVVTLCGQQVFLTDIVPLTYELDANGYETSKSRNARLAKARKLEDACKDWVNEKYPNYKDPLAYWKNDASERVTLADLRTSLQRVTSAMRRAIQAGDLDKAIKMKKEQDELIKIREDLHEKRLHGRTLKYRNCEH